jgi:predicted DNA-binding protein with PD1-like motif
MGKVGPFLELATKEYEKKQYSGIFEVASLNGDVVFLKGKPMAHIHVVLGDQAHEAISGHLVSGHVGVTLELTVLPIDQKHERVFNSETGLPLVIH